MRLGRIAVPAAVGVVLLGGTTAVQDTAFRSKIEDKLTDSSHSALAKAGVEDAKVTFAGRDGKVTASSTDAAVKAGGVVEDVTGVRTVHAFGPHGEVSLDGATAARAGSDGHRAGGASGDAGSGASASASASAGADGSDGSGGSGGSGASASASSDASSGSDSGSSSGSGSGEAGSDGSAGAEASSGTSGETGTATTEERKAAQGKLAHVGRITFQSDSDTPSSAGLKVVRAAAAVLKEYPDVAVRVEGFTDSAGSAAHGLALSERRAKRVAYELEKLGIDADRLSWKGYGESHPIPGASDAENRRVEFVVTD